MRGVQPTYPFSSVDVISDRSPLRKLYAFAAGDANLKEFRFGVSVFGEGVKGVKGGEKQGEEKQGEEKQPEEEPGEEKQADEKQGDEKQADEKQADEKQADEKQAKEKKTTVVFHRMEKMTREEYQAGHFHGYRAGFEAQYLPLDEMAKGSSSHYRISEYDFGGLKFLTRSGVDGSIPTPASTNNKNLKAEDSDLDTTITKLKIEYDEDPGKGKSTSMIHEPALEDADGSLSIIPTANGMAEHSTMLEFITRSENVKFPFDIATKMPDLYFSQTPHFVEAYHHNPAGWRYRAPHTLTSMFALADLRVRDMQAEFKKWEKRNGEVLGRYLAVVKQILDVVKGRGEEIGVWEVSYAREGSGLEVKEVVEGEGVVMRKEVGKFFGGEDEVELAGFVKG